MLRSERLVALGVVHQPRGVSGLAGEALAGNADGLLCLDAPAEPCPLAPAHRANAAADSDAVAFLLTEGRPSLIPRLALICHPIMWRTLAAVDLVTRSARSISCPQMSRRGSASSRGGRDSA